MPYDPRVTLPQQFPSGGPLLDPRIAQMYQNLMGGSVMQHSRMGAMPGLLDTTNAPSRDALFGPQRGLLSPQPVVFDRATQQRGVNSLLGTEGARMYYPGGGSGARSFYQGGTEGRLTDQYPMDLRGGGGERPPAPPLPKWQPQWETEYEESGGRGYAAQTPSGVQVVMSPKGGSGLPNVQGNHTEVMFHEPEKSLRQVYGHGGSMKRSLERFGDVFTAVRDYVHNFSPDNLIFSSAGGSHTRLYDKLAPKLAKELGGSLTVLEPGKYHIDLTGR